MKTMCQQNVHINTKAILQRLLSLYDGYGDEKWSFHTEHQQNVWT